MHTCCFPSQIFPLAIVGLFLKIACDMTEALFYSAVYTAKLKKVALVIGHWVFGRMEQCKKDLLK